MAGIARLSEVIKQLADHSVFVRSASNLEEGCLLTSDEGHLASSLRSLLSSVLKV